MIIIVFISSNQVTNKFRCKLRNIFVNLCGYFFVITNIQQQQQHTCPQELKRRVAAILRLRKPRLFSIDKRRRKRNDSHSCRSSNSSL